jgi:hypothetical protein
MHTSILVAAISVGIMVFARLFMGVLILLGGGGSILAVAVPIVVALLILYGIVMGHRLAWQWGRLLGLFGGVLLTLGALGVLARSAEGSGYLIAGVLLLLQGLPLFPMFFALGRPGAREHFRLTCPQCGYARPKGGNFLFTKAICRKCAASWT